MITCKKILLKLLLCFVFSIAIGNIKAQVCSGSWTFNNPLTLGCQSGQWVGMQNPTANPVGCPTNPTYTTNQTNIFSFNNQTNAFTIDFSGFDSNPGCARIEVKINGIFYPLTSANIIDFAQNTGGPCTEPSPVSNVVVTTDGYITNNLQGAAIGGIHITNVNATSVTISTNDANGTLFTSPYNCLNVVPLKLISFKGQCIQCKAQLNWETETESNVRIIEVQKSKDGVIFNKVWEVSPKGNNSHYSFETANFSNEYFRLKINDLDGSYEYSETIYIKSSCNENSYIAIPNPTSDQLEIVGLKNNDQVLILDMLGNVVTRFHSSRSTNKFNIQTLPAGMYIFQIINGISNASLKVIKY